jgi:hypothetical protein
MSVNKEQLHSASRTTLPRRKQQSYKLQLETLRVLTKPRRNHKYDFRQFLNATPHFEIPTPEYLAD